MPGSAIQSIRVSRAGGATTWILAIADRRWVWAESGEITGEYNIEVEGEVLVSSAKTPRQLAELCLAAMGETGYDISAVPIDDRPYVDWKVANPAQALSQLVEPYGLAVNLRFDNTVAIVKIGTGSALPAGFLTSEDSVEPAVTPRHLRVVSAPIKYAVDLKCEAVGEDTDGKIKPIDELSYKPLGGWEVIPERYDYSIVEFEFDRKSAELAKESVFRWYRVQLGESEDPESSLIDLPDGTPAVRDLYQILPLIDEESGTAGDDEAKATKRSFIWGKYSTGHSLSAQNTQDDVDTAGFKEEYRITEADFSLDTELGIVKFSQPIHSRGPNPDTDTDQPATIYVRCAINVRFEGTRATTRIFKQIDVDPTSLAGIKYVVRDDIVPRYYKDADSVWQDNLTAIEPRLDFYISQELPNFQTFPGQTADYPGFVPLNNDGAIRQVSYTINTDGTAVSKVTRNIERYDMSLSYGEAKKRLSIAVARQEAERNRRKRPERRSEKPPAGNG